MESFHPKRFLIVEKGSSHKKEELFTEKFFGEPKRVLLWHHCEKPLLEPLFVRVGGCLSYVDGFKEVFGT